MLLLLLFEMLFFCPRMSGRMTSTIRLPGTDKVQLYIPIRLLVVYRLPALARVSHAAALDYFASFEVSARASLAALIKHHYPLLSGRLSKDVDGGSIVDVAQYGKEEEADHIDPLQFVSLHFGVSDSDWLPSADDCRSGALHSWPLKEIHDGAPFDELQLLSASFVLFGAGKGREEMSFNEEDIVVVGILSLNHRVGDAFSAIQLFKNWASLCKDGDIHVPPYLDRSALISNEVSLRLELPSPETEQKARAEERFDCVEYDTASAPPLEQWRFRFFEQHLCATKKSLSLISSESFTKNDIIVAALWRAAVRAGLQEINEGNRSCPLVPRFACVPASVRGRVGAVVPSQYFGNAIVLAMSSFSSHDTLIAAPFVEVVDKVHTSVQQALEERRALTSLAMFASKEHNFGFPRDPWFALSSWVQGDIYSIDYGFFGRPILASSLQLPVFCNLGFMVRSAPESGDGAAVDVLLTLPVPVLHRMAQDEELRELGGGRCVGRTDPAKW